jgi:hypothetical protein
MRVPSRPEQFHGEHIRSRTVIHSLVRAVVQVQIPLLSNGFSSPLQVISRTMLSMATESTRAQAAKRMLARLRQDGE